MIGDCKDKNGFYRGLLCKSAGIDGIVMIGNMTIVNFAGEKYQNPRMI